MEARHACTSSWKEHNPLFGWLKKKKEFEEIKEIIENKNASW